MSTDIAKRGPADDVELSTMEKVVVQGDLAKLSSAERLSWYRSRCDAAGLDPRTQPFQYIILNSKLTLYATKTATDQLIATRKLTVEIVDRQHLGEIGIFEVRCRVKFPDGHHVEDFAAVSVQGIRGEAFCNAMMKCVSKAKRRTVLSACGLGMLDETEVETIPGAARATVAPPPAPVAAGPELVAEYREWLVAFVDRINAHWHARCPGGADLVNRWRLSRHLLKWGRESGRIEAGEDSSAAEADRLASTLFDRAAADVEAEAGAYCRRLWAESRAKAEAGEVAPEDATQEVAEEDEPFDETETRATEAVAN